MLIDYIMVHIERHIKINPIERNRFLATIRRGILAIEDEIFGHNENRTQNI
jgi:hypothetical protein